MVGLLYSYHPDQLDRILKRAIQRHLEKLGTEANCVYVKPSEQHRFKDCGLQVIADKSTLKNHFWVCRDVKS